MGLCYSIGDKEAHDTQPSIHRLVRRTLALYAATSRL